MPIYHELEEGTTGVGPGATVERDDAVRERITNVNARETDLYARHQRGCMDELDTGEEHEAAGEHFEADEEIDSATAEPTEPSPRSYSATGDILDLKKFKQDDMNQELRAAHRVKNLFRDYLWQLILAYVDDDIIFSSTLEDHLSHLKKMPTMIEESGVTIPGGHKSPQRLQIVVFVDFFKTAKVLHFTTVKLKDLQDPLDAFRALQTGPLLDVTVRLRSEEQAFKRNQPHQSA
ncbi:MAG: hypothetical protein Q9157_003421 [Trypethelium eluteriae]